MSNESFSCPSCGAPLEIVDRFAVVVTCQYCGNTSYLNNNTIESSGTIGKITDFPSVFSAGKNIVLQQQNGKISAQIRYSYEEGYWDEFFLVMENGKKYWLQEDEGSLTLFKKESLTSPLPPKEEIVVGGFINVGQENVFITEKYSAQISGMEGALPFKIITGEEVLCVDGNANGEVVSFEISKNEIFYSKGQDIEYNDIVIV